MKKRLTWPVYRDNWLTVEEAAEQLGVSVKHVNRLARTGKVEAAKMPSGWHSWRLKPESVIEWKEKQSKADTEFDCECWLDDFCLKFDRMADFRCDFCSDRERRQK